MRQNISYLELIWRPDPVAELRARGLDPSVDVLLTPKGPDGIVRFGAGGGARVTSVFGQPFTFTPAQIRTFNSVPIDLVIPATPTTFIAPGECVFIGAQGSIAYSGPPSPLLQYQGSVFGSTAQFDGSGTWDGSIAAVGFNFNMFQAIANVSTQNVIAALGASLQITSSQDVTGGDAPCTILLSYNAYELIGRL